MLNNILNTLDPTPHINNIWNFCFPYEPEDDLILTKEEKSLIVTQIEDVKSHLNAAKQHIKEENFDKAISEIENAINVSTCSRCQKKMLLTGFDTEHAENICALDNDRCETLTANIVKNIDEFINDYLPKVEDVLRAREE